MSHNGHGRLNYPLLWIIVRRHLHTCKCWYTVSDPIRFKECKSCNKRRSWTRSVNHIWVFTSLRVEVLLFPYMYLLQPENITLGSELGLLDIHGGRRMYLGLNRICFCSYNLHNIISVTTSEWPLSWVTSRDVWPSLSWRWTLYHVPGDSTQCSVVPLKTSFVWRYTLHHDARPFL